MKVKTIINNLEIVATQQVLVTVKQEIDLVIDKDVLSMCLLIDVDEAKEPLTYLGKVDNDKLYFTIYNVLNLPSIAIIEPRKIGVYNDRELYVSFFIEEIKKTKFFFLTYQILLGKEVDNGEK